jgi:hypothetical protein
MNVRMINISQNNRGRSLVRRVQVEQIGTRLEVGMWRKLMYLRTFEMTALHPRNHRSEAKPEVPDTAEATSKATLQ